MSLVIARNLTRNYLTGEVTVKAVQDVSFDIAPASFVSFVGPSGSGKSTVLNMIGALDLPTAGSLTVAGRDVTILNSGEAADFRGEHIGFIFQDFNLLPVLTVYENVEYPLLMVRSLPKRERRRRVMEVLQAVEMEGQAAKYSGQLSGGQKQRVAVARALVTEPELVLADEPTANLDSVTAHRVIELMHQMRDKWKTTFIFSTHDPKVMEAAETVFTLVDGRLQDGKGGAA